MTKAEDRCGKVSMISRCVNRLRSIINFDSYKSLFLLFTFHSKPGIVRVNFTTPNLEGSHYLSEAVLIENATSPGGIGPRLFLDAVWFYAAIQTMVTISSSSLKWAWNRLWQNFSTSASITLRRINDVVKLQELNSGWVFAGVFILLSDYFISLLDRIRFLYNLLVQFRPNLHFLVLVFSLWCIEVFRGTHHRWCIY